MSYIRGTAGSIVSLIGDNVYPLPDTAIYFGSVSVANRARIVEGSFSDDYTAVQVYVPDKLPQLSNIIFYNSVEYATGKGQFKFIGNPIISGLSALSGVWRDQISMTGVDFIEVNSVRIGELEAAFSVTSELGLNFVIPSEAKNGFVSISATGGQTFFLTESGSPLLFLVSEPKITVDGFFPTSGRFGEEVSVSGLSFHKANEVRISGLEGEIVITDFVKINTTGIKFNIPGDSLTQNPIKILKTVDTTLGGYYLSKIIEKGVSSGNLKINNQKILSFSPLSGIYGESISVSGLNLSGASIFFRSYSLDELVPYYIEPLSTNYIGNTGALVRVPKEIIKDRIYVSGNLFNCVLSVTGSGTSASQKVFQDYLSSGTCGDFSAGYESGHYFNTNFTYRDYTYRSILGTLAISGRTSGICESGFYNHFVSGYTGTYLGSKYGYPSLVSGVYFIQNDPGSIMTTSGASLYEITGANTGTHPFASGWVKSGSIVSEYHITSGDIYDVLILPSPNQFTPLPTITGIRNLSVGEPFAITGINCSEIHNLLLISGENRLKSNCKEIAIISNKDYQFLSQEGQEIHYLEYFRYLGEMTSDLTQITGNFPASAKTGNFILTGTLNDTFIGSGRVFLISKHDSPNRNYDFNYFSEIKSFSGSFSDFSTLKNVEKVLSEFPIIVSGKRSEISDSINVSAGSLIITGKYLQDVTGIFFTGLAGNLSTGLFFNLTPYGELVENQAVCSGICALAVEAPGLNEVRALFASGLASGSCGNYINGFTTGNYATGSLCENSLQSVTQVCSGVCALAVTATGLNQIADLLVASVTSGSCGNYINGFTTGNYATGSLCANLLERFIYTQESGTSGNFIVSGNITVHSGYIGSGNVAALSGYLTIRSRFGNKGFIEQFAGGLSNNLISGEPSVFSPEKDFYNRDYSLTFFNLPIEISPFFRDSGNILYQDRLRYSSGQMFLKSPYHE